MRRAFTKRGGFTTDNGELSPERERLHEGMEMEDRSGNGQVMCNSHDLI